MCHQDYDYPSSDEWSDVDAELEYRENFNSYKPHVIVCEDCYRSFMKHRSDLIIEVRELFKEDDNA